MIRNLKIMASLLAVSWFALSVPAHLAFQHGVHHHHDGGGHHHHHTAPAEPGQASVGHSHTHDHGHDHSASEHVTATQRRADSAPWSIALAPAPAFTGILTLPAARISAASDRNTADPDSCAIRLRAPPLV